MHEKNLHIEWRNDKVDTIADLKRNENTGIGEIALT